MNGRYSGLQALLMEGARLTVAGAFNQFLDKEINIPRGARSAASTSQNHLRDFLNAEADRDVCFPRILSNVDSDFLGGSFARHSKIWPLDDIDVFFPLDGHSLVYSRYGSRLPYTVLTDAVLDYNPLLSAPARWMTGSSISSRKVIDGFAKVLRRHYPVETRIRRAGEAVNVTMDHLGFDVVPCFSLRPDSRSETPFYVIPDGEDGWIHTNPRIDSDVSAQLQSKNDKKFRPAVKLVKWWNVNRFADQLSSYYIELGMMHGFLNKNQWGACVSVVSDSVALGFESLRDAAFTGNLTGWIPSAPPVERGNISADDLQFLNDVAGAARNAVNAEVAGDSQRALEIWRAIFGPKFPID